MSAESIELAEADCVTEKKIILRNQQTIKHLEPIHKWPLLYSSLL